MRKQPKIDFVVDTIGHCFICMEQIPPSNSNFPTIQSTRGVSTTSICSMQYVSRYLKLKMRKVFQQEDLIPEHLLDKVDMSKLKVALCKECDIWNAKLSNLVRQLDKIEVEAASYVQLIYDKLKRADEDGKSDLSRKLVDDGSGLMGKLQIAEALRKETAHKCSRKIQSRQPKIRIKKFSKMDLAAASDKLRHNSWTSKQQRNILNRTNSTDLPIPETEVNDSKREHDDREETSCIENYYVDDFEDEDMDSEQNSSTPKIGSHSQAGLPVNITTSKLTQKRKFGRNPHSGKLKCCLCSKEFGNYSGAKKHYQTVHLNVRFKCNICNKVFTQKSSLMTHQKSAHLNQRFNCQSCSMSFSTAGARRRHIRTNKCKFEKKRNSSNQKSPFRSNSKVEDQLEASVDVEIKTEGE